MKKLIILFLFLAIPCTQFAQDKPIQPTIEYASVFLKMYYQGNLVDYDKKGTSKSPLLYMPDGNAYILEDISDPNDPKKLYTVNDILNYMASFGWVFKDSNMLPYNGDSGGDSKSNIINTNQFMQVLIFERDVQQ